MRPMSPPVRAHRSPVVCRVPRVLALFGLALIVLGVAAGPGIAAPRAQETGSGQTITIGGSLNETQKKELLAYFKASPDDDVTIVTPEDTKKAMAGIFDYDPANGAFSSTALSCRDLGQGLDVTTRNITASGAVTPALYAMALATAGIGDATLVVAAPNDAVSLGLTALAGVFLAFEGEPCESGDTAKERQRLALEELTLAFTIGQRLLQAGDQQGINRASVIVLETQKTIVIEGLTKRNAIEAALTVQEKGQGISIPRAERRQLVDLFVRLAEQDINWSTFADGWNIDYPSANRIKMTGEGIAIRNAQASATAEAAAQLTATAQAAAAMTATAQAAANQTATAQAQAQAQAQATADAIAALTATAAAMPTATAVPTATPAPSSVSGTVVRNGGDEIVVQPDAAMTPVTYKVDPAATITRAGAGVAFAEVAKGDAVQLVVNGSTKLVTNLVAVPPPVSILERFRLVLYLLPIGVLVPAVVWARGRKPAEPFVVKRVLA